MKAHATTLCLVAFHNLLIKRSAHQESKFFAIKTVPAKLGLTLARYVLSGFRQTGNTTQILLHSREKENRANSVKSSVSFKKARILKALHLSCRTVACTNSSFPSLPRFCWPISAYQPTRTLFLDLRAKPGLQKRRTTHTLHIHTRSCKQQYIYIDKRMYVRGGYWFLQTTRTIISRSTFSHFGGTRIFGCINTPFLEIPLRPSARISPQPYFVLQRHRHFSPKRRAHRYKCILPMYFARRMR